MDTSLIRDQLERALDPYRFWHTIGVADTVRLLADIYGADAQKAYLAGLLHDCAREIPKDMYPSECMKRGLSVSECERSNPILLHAKLGAALAEEKYCVHDPEVLEAIRVHTTGKPDMTLVEKLVFISDYIEPGRDRADNLPALRRAAFSDPDRALLMILEDTLAFLRSLNKPMDPSTLTTYEYYKEAVK